MFDPSKYNVVWDWPSRDSSGSMPLGNGDIGANVWVESGGDLLFYLSKTDSWDGYNRLLKLGRVRVKLSPNPFAAGGQFRQELDLARGRITIHASADREEKTHGRDAHAPSDAAADITIWIDANMSVVRLEIAGPRDISAAVTLEPWRTDRNLRPDELGPMWFCPQDVVKVEPDTVVYQDGGVTWYHRNETSCWADNLKLQGLGEMIGKVRDPLLGLTWGGAIRGAGFQVAPGAMPPQVPPLGTCAGMSSPGEGACLRESQTAGIRGGMAPSEGMAPNSLISQPAKSHQVAIHVLTSQTASAADWLAQLEQQIARVEAVKLEDARAAHDGWWREFWQRSWIEVKGDKDAQAVSCGYALQRFVTACAGRGAFPIKFNGSIFTVDAAEEWGQPDGQLHYFDADYRRWGGCFWFQNCRHSYWPMLACGDFEMMMPFFRMYGTALPLAAHRSQAWFGHDGAMFPETTTFWGTHPNLDYGLSRSGLRTNQVVNTYVRHYWSGGLELSTLMLECWEHTGDRRLLDECLLRVAPAVVEFYDKHFGRDENGKLCLANINCLEVWQTATNPMPDIAGLYRVLKGLLSLPQDATTAGQRADWTRLLGELPPLPARREFVTTNYLIPAEKYTDKLNGENAELYSVFPYKQVHIGKDARVGVETFNRRVSRDKGCWRQDPIQAAMLGLTDDAREYMVYSFTHKNEGSRFPAFWGPANDWIPDQDHGCAAMTALQMMILQSDGQELRVLPAWPSNWDVQFKLHAPMGTVVQGEFAGGKLIYVRTEPPERAKDIVP